VILGLPGETRKDMLETAREVKRLGIDGVKIHLLHVLKGSGLETFYKEGNLKLPDQDEYAELVCDFLGELSCKTIVQRLTGEGTRADHLAPEWALDKRATLDKILKRIRGGRSISSCQAG
jgi:radical SAM superfamily enzyme